MKDVLFLVADKNMEHTVKGLLELTDAHRRIGCASFTWEVVVAVGQSDPGLFTRASEILRPFRDRFRHAIVMLDAQWEGAPDPVDIRQRIDEHLNSAGWPTSRGLGIVIVPELEAWLWTDSDHTAKALGWRSRDDLAAALTRNGYLTPSEEKPSRPKEAVLWALRQVRKPRSSTVYAAFSARASLERCADPALRELVDTVRRWFPLPDKSEPIDGD
jgi:hypothetical protein